MPSLKLMLYSLPPRLHPAFEILRQRVHDRHADAVQAAGELVVLVRELAAGVQPREDQLDAADLLLRVDVDRHAAAVVRDFQRAVLVQRHVDALGVAGQRLVDRVVDDFVREMVGAAGVRVHAGPAAYRVEPAQDFDVGGGVAIVPSTCERAASGISRARILARRAACDRSGSLDAALRFSLSRRSATSRTCRAARLATAWR